MLKLMITAASSSSGKTAVTCGLLALLQKKGYDPCAFKCGPDYIDPMFHRSVLGIESNNLDVFLAGEEGVRVAFARGSRGHTAAVCEGVMGYYDGMSDPEGISSARASAWHVGALLDLPAILVVRPKGTALTLAAVIKGMMEFRRPSRICGVILNDCSEVYARMYGPAIEAECGIPVLGYVPHMEEAAFESRHLGLMTAEEIGDLAERIRRIGARMEETLDWERLLAAASEKAGEAAGEAPSERGASAGPQSPVRIAVAKDPAFNFIYSESISALEEAGAEIAYFSLLKDASLPEGAAGLYLPGGYPELYAKQLSENAPMRACVREAVRAGLPTVAECGGFLYLGEELKDAEGNGFAMCGALPGQAEGKGRLVRFGYGMVSSEKETMLLRPGEKVPVHEFHYWDTAEPGSDLTLTKQSTGRTWAFGYAGDALYAGFPHLYLAGRPEGSTETLAERFARAAKRYAAGRREK